MGRFFLKGLVYLVLAILFAFVIHFPADSNSPATASTFGVWAATIFCCLGIAGYTDLRQSGLSPARANNVLIPSLAVLGVWLLVVLAAAAGQRETVEWSMTWSAPGLVVFSIVFYILRRRHLRILGVDSR